MCDQELDDFDFDQVVEEKGVCEQTIEKEDCDEVPYATPLLYTYSSILCNYCRIWDTMVMMSLKMASKKLTGLKKRKRQNRPIMPNIISDLTL